MLWPTVTSLAFALRESSEFIWILVKLPGYSLCAVLGTFWSRFGCYWLKGFILFIFSREPSIFVSKAFAVFILILQSEPTVLWQVGLSAFWFCFGLKLWNKSGTAGECIWKVWICMRLCWGYFWSLCVPFEVWVRIKHAVSACPLSTGQLSESTQVSQFLTVWKSGDQSAPYVLAT